MIFSPLLGGIKKRNFIWIFCCFQKICVLTYFRKIIWLGLKIRATTKKISNCLNCPKYNFFHQYYFFSQWPVMHNNSAIFFCISLGCWKWINNIFNTVSNIISVFDASFCNLLDSVEIINFVKIMLDCDKSFYYLGLFGFHFGSFLFVCWILFWR